MTHRLICLSIFGWLACTACGEPTALPPVQTTPVQPSTPTPQEPKIDPVCDYGDTIDDGSYLIDVEHGNGFVDTVGIRIASPDAPGQYPVFVWLPGQGMYNIVKCAEVNEDYQTRQIQTLVEAGYVVATLVYRNESANIDVAPNHEQPFRDDRLMDPLGALQAAVFANTHVSAEPERRTFIGGGSWGARVTAHAIRTDEPDFVRRQNCIDLRGAIINASGVVSERPPNGKIPKFSSAGAFLDLIYGTVYIIAAHLKTDALRATDFVPGASSPLAKEIQRVLKPRGIELFRRVFFDAAERSLEGCIDAVPDRTTVPVCIQPSPWECFTATFNDVWQQSHPLPEADSLDVREWFTEYGLGAWLAEDPSHPLQAGGRWAEVRRTQAPLATKNVFYWISPFDPAYRETAVASLTDMLVRRGATVSTAVIEDPSCRHLDYFQNANCGIQQVLAKLATW